MVPSDRAGGFMNNMGPFVPSGRRGPPEIYRLSSSARSDSIFY